MADLGTRSLPFRFISFNPTSGLWYTLTGFFLLQKLSCDRWHVLEAFLTTHKTKIGRACTKKTQPLPPSLLSPICPPYPHGIAPPAPGATPTKKPSCVSCGRWPARVRSGRQSRRPSVVRRPLPPLDDDTQQPTVPTERWRRQWGGAWERRRDREERVREDVYPSFRGVECSDEILKIERATEP